MSLSFVIKGTSQVCSSCAIFESPRPKEGGIFSEFVKETSWKKKLGNTFISVDVSMQRDDRKRGELIKITHYKH